MPETNALGQPLGPQVRGWQPPPRPAHEFMTGRYCRLEPLAPGRHAVALHAANCLDADDRMWTYLPYGPFGSLETYRAWMDGVCPGHDPQFYAILDGQTGQATGVASYLRIDPRNGSLEVGHLAFSPALQRTPAATEAMFLMMAHAFGTGYRRYEWKCNALNEASRSAASRLGFSFEGIFRQAAVVKGRNRDTAWYAVIDRDWPALRSAFLEWLEPGNFDARGIQKTRLSVLTAAALRQPDRSA